MDAENSDKEFHIGKKGIIFIGGILGLVTIATAVFFTLQFFPQVDRLNGKNLGGKDPFGDLRGRIHQTLALKGDYAADLYFFDIETRQFKLLFNEYRSPDWSSNFGDMYVGYTSKFSSRGDKFAYAVARLLRENERTRGSTIVFMDPLEITTFDIKTGKWLPISRSFLYNKRLPQWSPDDTKLIFNAVDGNEIRFDPDGFFYNPNAWGVYLVDAQGKERRLTNGAYPHWSPDGSRVLFMRSDGLYMYSFESENSERVYSFSDGNVTFAAKLGLSRDGELLALTNPPTHDVKVFDVVSWEPFTISIKKRIFSGETSFFWPVFSPDSQYLVVQASDWDDASEGKRSNQRLVVYELKNFESKTIASLADYNFDAAFITDWQY